MAYYAMISHLDDSIGRVVKSLKDSGMYEDTIIIFAADNGLAVGQHGLMGKQNTYEHSIRVPFVISGPGIPKGETRDKYIYLLDIFPTICDFVGADIPRSVEGKSFKPIVDSNENETREYIFAAYSDKARSVKNRKYKLIQYKYQDIRKVQFFDLQADPWEMNDLSHDPSMQQIIHELRKKLHEFAEDWEDAKTPEGKRFWTEYEIVHEEGWGW
jgi:arylsulfatase A-like enzyme